MWLLIWGHAWKFVIFMINWKIYYTTNGIFASGHTHRCRITSLAQPWRLPRIFFCTFPFFDKRQINVASLDVVKSADSVSQHEMMKEKFLSVSTRVSFPIQRAPPPKVARSRKVLFDLRITKWREKFPLEFDDRFVDSIINEASFRVQRRRIVYIQSRENVYWCH